MDRAQLADFLRRCRTRLDPAVHGRPDIRRRRTPGLRREEVAQLAAISTDYYTRLEQARGPQPTTQVCAALARALQLTDDERDHLFRLIGHEPPPRTHTAAEVRPALLDLLDRLWDRPAQVIDDLGMCLAQNALMTALVGDLAGAHGWDRSYYWRWFTQPSVRELTPPEDHEQHSRTNVADLRATATRRADDPRVAEFIHALRQASAEFEALWAEHAVAVRRSDTKRFLHPRMGRIEVSCEVLLTADSGQRLLVYSARPDTLSHDRLQLLAMEVGQVLPPAEPSGESAREEPRHS